MLKAVLKNKGTIPYGSRYVLNIPEKGIVAFGTNFEMLLTNAKAYRRANGIPVGLGFEDEVEREVCAAYPAECIETDSRIPDRQRRYTFTDVIAGTKAMIAFKLAGSPLVDQAEANRRAAICAKCPNNVSFVSGCNHFCGELKDIVLDLIGVKTTPHDVNLHSCAICGCYAQASVWVELGVQVQGLTDIQKLQFQTAKEQHGCWKVE